MGNSARPDVTNVATNRPFDDSIATGVSSPGCSPQAARSLDQLDEPVRIVGDATLRHDDARRVDYGDISRVNVPVAAGARTRRRLKACTKENSDPAATASRSDRPSAGRDGAALDFRVR